MFDTVNLKSGAFRVYPAIVPTRISRVEVASNEEIVEFKEGERVVTYQPILGLGTTIEIEYENITLEVASILSDFYMLCQGGFNAFKLPRRIWRHRTLKKAFEGVLEAVGWVFAEPLTLSVVRDNRVTVRVLLRAVDNYSKRADWLTTPRYEIKDGALIRSYQGNTDLLFVCQCDAGLLEPQSSRELQTGLKSLRVNLEALPEYPGKINQIYLSPANDLSEVLNRYIPINAERRDSVVVVYLVYESLEFFDASFQERGNIGRTHKTYQRLQEYYEHLSIYVYPMRTYEDGVETAESVSHRTAWQNLIQNEPNAFNDVGFKYRSININLNNFVNTLDGLQNSLRLNLDPYYL